MEELKDILIAHAKRYPLMQPRDVVKLIYQNEFGGGHLIRDEQACLNYLRREYDSITKKPNALLYEEIGNGIVNGFIKPSEHRCPNGTGYCFSDPLKSILYCTYNGIYKITDPIEHRITSRNQGQRRRVPPLLYRLS